MRVAAVAVVVQILVGVLAWWLLGLAGLLVPLLLQAHLWDLALAIMEPIERRISYRFVADARRKLKRVHPTVVAITGSYGKTSTKGYVAHLVGSTHQTVASPASFNNLMGLSRTINEHLVVGTGVFVAEMGMNQEGQIRELTQRFPPDIAAITVIGEAHMERLGSKEAIFRAKSEITENASTVVLPVDQPELVALSDKCRRDGKKVITVSATGKPADVVVDPQRGTVRYGPGDQEQTMDVPPFGLAVNIAVALGIAWALEVPKDQALSRLSSLPVAAHRAEVQRTNGGVWIIDDTYNSNPVGSTHAVAEAHAVAKERGGPLVVVTPGMVELGPVQVERNRALGRCVIDAGGTLMIVGRTNRQALLEGAGGVAEVFEGRADAVEAALRVAGDKGVILYENDLPDHYP
jgi:UDP-N-acetylmuramoyl-tripeptide--D-alanyl-D-alanine ligase